MRIEEQKKPKFKTGSKTLKRLLAGDRTISIAFSNKRLSPAGNVADAIIKFEMAHRTHANTSAIIYCRSARYLNSPEEEKSLWIDDPIKLKINRGEAVSIVRLDDNEAIITAKYCTKTRTLMLDHSANLKVTT